MEDDDPNKKMAIKLDWDDLMAEDKDDDPPPELVVAGDRKRSPPTEEEGGSEFAGMSDALIEEQINKYKGHVAMSRRLPDNGEKLKARIKLLEDERGRRKLRQANDDGRDRLTQSKRQNFTSASADFMETTPSTLRASESEFGTLLNRKLDENRRDSRVVNAFESELSYFSHGGNRNARFKGQVSKRGRLKSMLSSRQSPFHCPTKLSIDTNKSNFSVGDQNQHGSTHLFQKCEKFSPDAFMKKSPSQFLSSKDSRPRNGNTFVLVDEEEPESDPELELIECMEQAEEVDECFDEGMVDCTINYPSRDDPESIEICYSDLQCLAPQAFLSSTIMNFYIRHLQQPTLATERGSCDYYFFNTYFYSKLTEAVSEDAKENSFPRLRRWWKGIDIFRKPYILLPIHENLHWSLVIICIPDKEDCLGPIILHLDSLGLHSSHLIFNNVKSFLREEWKHLNQSEAPYDFPFSDKIWKDLSYRIDEKRIEVPKQRNDYDCGLFVLYFMERFIIEAPRRMKRRDLAMFGRKWFKPEEASNLRQKIKKLLKEEFRKATHDNCASTPSTKVTAQEQKFEQPKDISKFVLVEAD